MSVGEEIRKGRKAAGLTMAELGDAVGVSVAAISRYELGQREPDQLTLMKICEVLGLSYPELCDKRYYEMSAQIRQAVDSVTHVVTPKFTFRKKEDFSEFELFLRKVRESFVQDYLELSEENQKTLDDIMQVMLKRQRKFSEDE